MLTRELQKQKALFAASDCTALVAAFGLALWLHEPTGSKGLRLASLTPVPLVAGLVAIGALWILVFHACDLYRMRNGGLREHLAIVKACTIAVLLTLLALFLAHMHNLPRLTVVLAYLLSIPFVQSGRAATRACLRRFYSSPRIAIPLVIFGFNPVSRYLLDQVLDDPTHYEPLGFLDASVVGREYRGYPLLGPPALLGDLSAACGSIEAAIAMPDASREQQEGIIRLCEENGVHWWMVPWMLNSLAAGFKVDLLGSIPLIGPRRSNIAGINYVLKRGFDLLTASVLIALTAPIVLLASALIRLTDGAPVLFRQTRVGLHGRPFELLKLRTMYSDTSDEQHRDYVRRWISDQAANTTDAGSTSEEQAVYKLQGDRRITPVGRILRRFSIDELPQLINVWRGEMSLIGPRPALPYEMELYQEWHRRRLDVAPGITGLWQVSGRNRLSFSDMVRLDVQYLEDWSLLGDLKILMRTVPTLLLGSGI